MFKKLTEKNKEFLNIFGVLLALLMVIVFVCFSYNRLTHEKFVSKTVDAIVYNSAKSEDFKQVFLSDLVPVEKRVGYGELVNDADLNGNPIILKVENNYFSFKKGIFAHANATLVYDLTDYADYNYFVTFIGLNNTSSRGNGVTYHFYTSLDKVSWNEIGTPIRKNPLEEATYVEIPLNGAKYLKLEVNDNVGNGQDHSVFGDAKLVNELNGNFILDSKEDYDALIKEKYNDGNMNEEIEHLVLKRELVKRVGYYTINSFYNENDDNKETISWLNNITVLRYYILGGTPDGNSYYNSLTQLSRLYKAYKDDFEIQETTKYGTVLGDLYTRMAIALSLTHSQRVGLWMQAAIKENQSDAVVRYQIYKDLHKNNKFRVTDNIDITKWFENYNVEDMRFVMNNLIDDESIVWLNEYVQSKIDANPNSAWGLLTPHSYIAYVWPNYGNPVYYDDANYDYFNELFSVNGKKLYDYGITRGTMDNKVYKVWMNFRNKFGTGAVCGGISKSGSNIRATHGIAATVIGQPGHAALLYYTEDNLGRGYWNIDNDVSGWTLSEKGERMLLGWGNGSYARGSYQVVYMALAQEVLNDYENFLKAEEYIMLARTYSNDILKQEKLVREALKIQPINFDGWYELIQIYNNNSTKTENDYFLLAEEIATNMKYFPLPMYHLTNLIKPKLTSIENTYKFTLLQTRILNEGKNTPNNTDDSYTVYQPSLTRIEANYLLGQVDSSIATFSFDGFDANKIVLSSRFDGNGIRLDYSLDGKKTWNEVAFTGEEEHKISLTLDQVNSITEENDIYVHIVGVSYEEKNLFKIDITKGTNLSDIFANDLENRIVGVNLNTAWRYKESDPWTSYSDRSPDLTGNKTVQIRQNATGTVLASDPSLIFTFTEDNQPDTRKYIPVSHLSIHAVSTEATSHAGAASKAIDGNYNTRYHSAWNGTDTERFMVIKLDKPVYLSAVEFVPAGGGNGKIYDGTVYGSMDGENWEVLSSLTNIRYTNQANTINDAILNTKSFEIEDVREVQYVKIVAQRTNGNWFTAREFNLYQDLTADPRPTAGIAYSTLEPTNGKVVARLVNPSTNITIINNNGSDTYTFTENGEFTFQFQDDKGYIGSATATVTWIDKDIPDADIDYELDSNHKISISLDDISEDIYLLDKNNNILNFVEVENKIVKSISYLDLNGNVYKTVFVDENGVITKINYVNTISSVSTVATYVTNIKNGVVVLEEYYDSEGNIVEVTAAERDLLKSLQKPITDPLEYTFEVSGDYEFKMRDLANNINIKSIKVDYEDDDIIIVSDISYDITYLTNKNVVASIKACVFNQNGEKTEAQIVSGGSTYTFTNNGKFTFKYKESNDEDATVMEHVAEVTWIDKVAPTAFVKYTELGNGNVLATLVNESEEIVIINNNASRDYIFTENGEFVFEFVDMVGNEGRTVAKVNSIKEEEEPKPSDPIPSDPTPNEPGEPENPDVPSDKPNEIIRPGKPSDNKPNTNKPGNNNGTINDNKPNNKPDVVENDPPELIIEDNNSINRGVIITLSVCIIGMMMVILVMCLNTNRKK